MLIRILDILGGYTLEVRNPDSWEGWYWGAKHVWGCEPRGHMAAYQANIYYDIARTLRYGHLLGLRPGDHSLGLGRPMASRFCYWFTELGIKQIYICPDLNYGAAVHADKWIPMLPNTDAALQLAIAHVWMTEDTYDKEYLETHAVGFDSSSITSWARKTAFPRRRNGRRASAGFPPASSRPWPATGRRTMSP